MLLLWTQTYLSCFYITCPKLLCLFWHFFHFSFEVIWECWWFCFSNCCPPSLTSCLSHPENCLNNIKQSFSSFYGETCLIEPEVLAKYFLDFTIAIEFSTDRISPIQFLKKIYLYRLTLIEYKLAWKFPLWCSFSIQCFF